MKLIELPALEELSTSGLDGEWTSQDLSRFLNKIDEGEACWLWQGGTISLGYPFFTQNGKRLAAHRVAYQMFVGPIPAGRKVKRICENILCLSPSHLKLDNDPDYLWHEFQTRIQKTETCWLWTGDTYRDGYGRFQKQGAHRIAYTAWKGTIPAGMVVMHRCDNPPCVNPDHLDLGTPADNARDMFAKGRNASGDRSWANTNRQEFLAQVVHRGVQKVGGWLDEEKVLEIRRRYALGDITQVDLAKEYDVTSSRISLIVTVKSWAHVGGPRTITRQGRKLR